MKIIRPTAITDAVLTSSDVPENDYPEFSMGSTYSSGDRVMDSTGLEILTLDVAPATEWSVGDLITGQTSGKTARVVLKLTSLTYQIRERTGSFTLGEIIGVTGVGEKLADQGAAHPTVTVATDKVHKIYEARSTQGRELLTLDVAPAVPWLPNWTLTGQTSGATCVVVLLLTSLTYLVKERTGTFALDEVIGVTGTPSLLADQGAAHPTFGSVSNVGNYPPKDLQRDTPLWWKEIGRTNRWRAFDSKVGSQTSQDALISMTLTPGLIDSVSLLNLDATSITLVLTDPLEGEVYSTVVDLISTLGIIDAYTYFFEPIIRTTDIVKSDLPPYGAASLEIEIANADGTAKIGEIVVGMKRDIGQVLYAPSVGIVDYSQKSADEDGNFSIVEGPYSKRYTCALRLPNTSFDELSRLFAYYRATPLVWVALEAYAAFIAYGKFNDFSIQLSGPLHSDCSLEIEGLT